MGVLLGKDRSRCATCVYWGGQRTMYGNDFDVDPVKLGKCLTRTIHISMAAWRQRTVAH
jgi:hypothetical protein